MNIELKPIAESKVRQLGGDVCGVLVRTEGGVMAVSEHGRCTRLDGGVMGPVDGAQGGQGAKPIGFTWDAGRFGRQFTADAGVADRVRVDGVAVLPVYTQPQPAVPEGWRVIRMPELQKALMTGPIIGLDGPRGESVPVVSDSDDRRERHLYQFLDALLSTPTTPRADGCEWHTDGNGCWMGACGKEFWFEDGGPSDNGMKYCLSCGKPCVEVGDPDEQSGGQDNAL